MTNQSSRGGMKQGQESDPQGKRHQGVRPGSTADAAERHQEDAREPQVPGNIETQAQEEHSRENEERHAKSLHPKNGQELPDDPNRAPL